MKQGNDIQRPHKGYGVLNLNMNILALDENIKNWCIFQANLQNVVTKMAYKSEVSSEKSSSCLQMLLGLIVFIYCNYIKNCI